MKIEPGKTYWKSMDSLQRKAVCRQVIEVPLIKSNQTKTYAVMVVIDDPYMEDEVIFLEKPFWVFWDELKQESN
jgi:hypothetical protein